MKFIFSNVIYELSKWSCKKQNDGTYLLSFVDEHNKSSQLKIKDYHYNQLKNACCGNVPGSAPDVVDFSNITITF